MRRFPEIIEAINRIPDKSCCYSDETVQRHDEQIRTLAQIIQMLYDAAGPTTRRRVDLYLERKGSG